MVPDSTSTHIEAPAREACQTLASGILANDAISTDAPASEAAAREAPASRECHFLRIPRPVSSSTF